MLTAEFLNHFPCETDMVINYIYIICLDPCADR